MHRHEWIPLGDTPPSLFSCWLQLFVIEDDRALFLFKDGSQAWEAKDFLLKQKEVLEVTLEGQVFPGPAAAKTEL